MSAKLNGQGMNGVLGYLIALPILVVTFLWLALTFLGMVLLFLSPLILVVLLIGWLI